MKETSWESAGEWYDKIVGREGHYYHQHVILPGALRLLDLREKDSVLDLACGQGILARHIPPKIPYTGMDISPSLIRNAKQHDYKGKPEFHIGDITEPFKLKEKTFTHSTLILALQNLADPTKVFKNVYAHLAPGGKFLIVLNHPCFRIPRQSSWQVDEPKKLQYRRVDAYLSTLKIPIYTHPSQGKDATSTLSFHYPLSAISSFLKSAGFVMEVVEEWASDKSSTGKNARMENRCRQEFPLFLTILAKKF